MKNLDLICMGRCNADLYVDQVGALIKEARSLSLYVGGSAANICLGAAHLGLKTAMITRTGKDQLGDFIRKTFAASGVNVEYVKADATKMTPQIFLAIHAASGFERIFDYPPGVASDLAVEESDIDPAFIASSKALLINGTLLSQEKPAAACKKAIRAARAAGVKIAFDVDFRPVLWGLTSQADSANMFKEDPATTKRLQEILPDCDLVVGTEEEIHILGGSTGNLEALRQIRSKTKAAIVLKRGTQNPVIFTGTIPADIEQGTKGPVFPVEVFNSTGAGDGFMAGFLRGWVDDEPVVQCATYASASAALVIARHGCGPAVPSWPELQHFLSLKDKPKRPWEDPTLNHLHWATVTRKGDHPELAILAFDHRTQFEELVKGRTDRIPEAKRLIAEAYKEVAAETCTAGLILDGQYGACSLESFSGQSQWMAQAIEQPQTTPLQFIGGRDIGLTLHSLPQERVIKCLVFYHTSDDKVLRDAQDNQILDLYESCRTLERELLLEILPPAGKTNSNSFAAETMQHFYNIGIKPDWWKLESPPDTQGWKNISDVIAQNDSYCRGVLLLGKNVSAAELEQQFARAREHGICKGFAVGRTIWGEPAAAWFAGKINDKQFIEKTARNYRAVIKAWQNAQPAQNRKIAL